MPQKALCKHQAKGRGINQGNLTISVNPQQMKLIIPRKKEVIFLKRNLGKYFTDCCRIS